MLNDTKVFGGASGAPQSIFATAVKSGPFSLAGNTAAFGGMRGTMARGMDDEDDDDDEVKREASVFSSGTQSLELREDSITFDQVSPPLRCLLSYTHCYLQAKRIARQSAWRTARV
jgi:hypothetical protein